MPMYIGEPFSWKPAAFQGSNGIMSVTTKETTAHGRVVYINEAHRYFTAEDINEKKLRESFKILTKIRRYFIMNTKQDYIIRCDRAGVFFGKIKERTGSEVTMTEVRKIWSWDGACAVEQLAQDGTKAPGNCRFTVTIPEMTVLGAIQIIPCTDAASASLRGVKEWKR